MPIRITGLASGLDTESLVTELVSAYNVKKDNYVKAQTKLSWKQDAWKSLNKKVYSLYSSVSNLRYSSAYSLKKTTVSDTTKATVKAGNNAINGTQKLVVKSLAATGYLTGGKLKTKDGSKAEGGTTLGNLTDNNGKGYGLGEGESGSINVNGKEISLSSTDTISSVVNKLKDAGVSASFDSTNQRLFVSSKESGKDNEFTLTASNEGGAKILQSLGLMTNISKGTAAYNEYASVIDKYSAEGEVDPDKIKEAIENGTLKADSYGDAAYQTAVKTYNYAVAAAKALSEGTEDTVKTAYQNYKNNQGKIDDLNEAGFNKSIYDGLSKASDTQLENQYLDKNGNQITVERDDGGNITKINGKEVDGEGKTEDGYAIVGDKITYTNPEDAEATPVEYSKAGDVLADMQAILTDKFPGSADVEEAYAAYTDTVNAVNEFMSTYSEDLSVLDQVYADGMDLASTQSLQSSSLDAAATAYSEKVQAALTAVNGSGLYTTSSGAVRIDATDSVIELNGAEFTGSTNSFSINGLSIDVTGTTDENGITITTSTDSQGIYDKVKDFLSQYNDLMNEMCSLYNAASAKGYEPLTADEKKAMSDTQVEDWEAKIKSALLRRDTTLDSLITAMTTSMQKGYVMGKDSNGNNITFTLNKDGTYKGSNGQNYTLEERSGGKYTMKGDDGSSITAANYSWSSFGVATLGLLNAASNENNAYHIDGDADDENTSGKTDKLLAAIASDPDTVIDFLKNATSSLYDSINKKMASTSLRSAYTVYNDKEMNKEYSDYTDTIKKWDEKVTKIEDSYYKKFAAMEKALTSIQGQSSALGGIL